MSTSVALSPKRFVCFSPLSTDLNVYTDDSSDVSPGKQKCPPPFCSFGLSHYPDVCRHTCFSQVLSLGVCTVNNSDTVAERSVGRIWLHAGSTSLGVCVL